MGYLKLMLKYYGNAASRSLKGALKNWPVMLVLLVYFAVIELVGIATAQIYIVGSLIMALVMGACLSSYLYMIENIIYSGKANMNDFRNSFTPYLRRILNIAFWIWLASMIYGSIIRFIPGGAANVINMIVYLAVSVVLNPLPEIIYQTEGSEINAFYSSYEFVRDNAAEWLIPNAIFSVCFYYLLRGGISFAGARGALSALRYLIALPVFLFMMIFRGILFRFLNGTTRRSRLFKMKMMD